MKKLLWILCLFIFAGNAYVYAGDDGVLDAKSDTKSTSKELKKLERKRKREQKRLEREQRKQEKLAKKTSKPDKKSKCKKKSKAAKKDKVKKDKIKKCSADKKQARNIKSEERKVKNELQKEQRAQARKERKEKCRLEKLEKEEKREAKKIEDENKSISKKESRRLKKQEKQEKQHMALLKEQKDRSAKLAKINEEKAQNLKLAQNWQTARVSAVEGDYKNGKYADLYMLPAWPVTNWFFKDKALINATAFYDYATDGFDSDGSSRDIAALAFSENPIHVQDIVLASKLLEEGKLSFRDGGHWISPVNQLINYWGDQEIKLNGKTEQYGLSLDFMRHVLRDDISVGIQVPVKFMRNRLDLHMNFPTDYQSYNHADLQDEGEFASLVYKEALKRILENKGIDKVGGSASGLGDITLFGNVEVTTKWIEKIVTGLKFVLPTGKKASSHKLWGPEMGNGGCTEVAAFISFLLKYKSYINPHLFLQAGFNIPTHVKRRVPAWDELAGDSDSAIYFPTDFMSLSDRFLLNSGQSVADWDSTVRGFGDKTVSTKFEKGPEITARIGNVFEKFLSRRGFMDIFYNLRVKFEDSYRQVDRDLYKIDILEDNTKQVEHRLGLEYSYQFDSRTRMKAGMIYTIAGINVPKAFDIGVSFAHSF